MLIPAKRFWESAAKAPQRCPMQLSSGSQHIVYNLIKTVKSFWSITFETVVEFYVSTNNTY